MITDHLETIPLSDLVTLVRLRRGPLVVEGHYKGRRKDAVPKMLPLLRKKLHEEWKKGPPEEAA